MIGEDAAKALCREYAGTNLYVPTCRQAAADERDARLAIEMPPGGVLTCLTRQAGWRGETISLERSGVDVARHLAQRLSD